MTDHLPDDANAGENSEYEQWLESHLKDGRTTEDQLYHAAMLIHSSYGSAELAERILEKVERGETISG